MAGFDALLHGPTLWLVLAIVAVAGFAHGTVGLGFPMISTPAVALVTDVRTAVMVTVVPNIAVNLVSIARGGRWRESLGRHWRIAVWVGIGTVIGTRLLLHFPPQPFELLLVAMIVVYLRQDWVRAIDWSWIARRPRTAEPLFGLFAGLLSGSVNVSAPPLLIYFMALGVEALPLTQIANLCFLTGKTVQAFALSAGTPLGARLVVDTLPLTFAALVALLLGMRLQRGIQPATYRALLRKTLWVIAAVLFARVLWSAFAGLR